MKIAPQPGPQTAFAMCQADVAIYGGAAGGGKTFSLLLEPLFHFRNKEFKSTIFRRNATQIKNQGAMWDQSLSMYGPLRANPREYIMKWEFPSGMSVKFAHLELDSSVFDYQGAQIPFIGFDELTHFTEYQFWYMLSRNRSMSGVKAYVRATCNPDCDSWVRGLIDWWIGEDGFAIPERSGKIRWFLRRDDKIHWADTKRELIDTYQCEPSDPKSFSFIPSKIYDNKIFLEKDPGYLSNLKALNRVDRERLLDGNWNARASAGSLFKRQWFEIIETIPAGWIRAVRYWDRAATKPNETNKDPDWTRGLKMLKYRDGTHLVCDIKSLRDTPLQVESLVKSTASQDTRMIRIYGEQDPGSAGVADAQAFVRMLQGYDVRIAKPTEDKVTRAKPVSAQSEAGNIKVLRAPWNSEFFSELENFPDGSHDDIVDVFSGAFNELSGGASILDVL